MSMVEGGGGGRACACEGTGTRRCWLCLGGGSGGGGLRPFGSERDGLWDMLMNVELAGGERAMAQEGEPEQTVYAFTSCTRPQWTAQPPRWNLSLPFSPTLSSRQSLRSIKYPVLMSSPAM